MTECSQAELQVLLKSWALIDALVQGKLWLAGQRAQKCPMVSVMHNATKLLNEFLKGHGHGLHVELGEPPSGLAWRGLFINHSIFQEDFGVAPVIGVSGVATTGCIWAESQKIPLVIGGIRIGDLAISNDVA